MSKAMDDVRVQYIRDVWPKSFEGSNFHSFMSKIKLIDVLSLELSPSLS